MNSVSFTLSNPLHPYPRMIALCGHPGSGKSEVQKILDNLLHYQPVDDGLPLRSFCVQHLGMSWNDVLSQEGKSGEVKILDTVWTRRKILGDYGNLLERIFGDNILPYMACVGLQDDKRYSFGSVRKRQAAFYKEQGALVIGVRNPLAGPSPYDFDWFDDRLVDLWIDNDSQANGLEREEGLLELAGKVANSLSKWRLETTFMRAAS